LDNYQNKLVSDTTLTVMVPSDLTTYYYQIRATVNNNLYSPISDSVSLTTTDGTPISQPATLIDKYSFRANWQRANYASGYFVDVFTLDSNTGDTTWLEGYKNFYLTKNYLEISDVDDQTTYHYQVRGTNGTNISRNSTVVTVSTTKATALFAYSKDRFIVLKGMDKGGKVDVHSIDGKLVASAYSNRIELVKPGIYLVTATFNGKLKHLKILVP
jgi:hypothetical protein